MLAKVGYIGYGSTYHATYNMLYGECATGELSECEGQKTSISTLFSAQVYLTYVYGTLP